MVKANTHLFPLKCLLKNKWWICGHVSFHSGGVAGFCFIRLSPRNSLGRFLNYRWTISSEKDVKNHLNCVALNQMWIRISWGFFISQYWRQNLIPYQQKKNQNLREEALAQKLWKHSPDDFNQLAWLRTFYFAKEMSATHNHTNLVTEVTTKIGVFTGSLVLFSLLTQWPVSALITTFYKEMPGGVGTVLGPQEEGEMRYNGE